MPFDEDASDFFYKKYSYSSDYKPGFFKGLKEGKSPPFIKKKHAKNFYDFLGYRRLYDFPEFSSYFSKYPKDFIWFKSYPSERFYDFNDNEMLKFMNYLGLQKKNSSQSQAYFKFKEF